MTREELCAKKQEAIEHFNLEGTLLSADSYGSGHINDTFLLRHLLSDGSERKLILQRINHEVFPHPKELMENLSAVTTYLREQLIRSGKDPMRETLNLVPASDQKPYYQDSLGSYWRIFHFIKDAACLDAVTDPESFYQSAVAFGNFQHLLAHFPAESLHETIPSFHNTKHRFQLLAEAVEKDVCNRAASCRAEIDFALSREQLANELYSKLESGELPLRVTHNDTKLNNIMFDTKTGKAICVIDLDTVMPGLAANDFGDSIRFGASTGAEDEQDLSKISCDMELFALYTKGFIEGCAQSLTEAEIRTLALGAITMTYECGIRFLTDYLNGDVYFKIHREGHNLDRCRTQLKLVADMETKRPEMERIAASYLPA